MALLPFLGSCTRGDHPDESKMIAFETNWLEMRSGVVEGQDSFHDDMQVTAFLQTQAGNPLGTLFQNLRVTKASGWRTNYPWLGSEAGRQLSFFAFAPYGALTPEWNQRSYTLTDNSGEVDVVAAQEVVPAHYGERLPLHFQHLLSGVSFVVHEETPDMVIYSVELRGILSTATYSIKQQQWADYHDPKTYTWSGEVEHIAGTSVDTPLTITPFFLIPQTLSDEMKLIVTLKRPGKSDTELKELSLSNQTLEIGEHYVLRLQLTE
ncbi:MAG: fimbrillin family protein [Porphyromonas somerae]|uniref:fimbrillin family protein n=1 Tax=Porphyromonas somerae TaxID=322095 RepID=UPI0026EFA0DE|nr:fimbrillin family protein [Porphyromonas somerae]MDD7557583.1 fimbrillin family protein [Porphyromonas somerae]MDY5815155.1 fimbrillin family protein [Porphyromonas somerae]